MLIPIDSQKALFVQANVNPKASVVEDFIGRRKALHIGSCRLMSEDLRLKSQNNIAYLEVQLEYKLY